MRIRSGSTATGTRRWRSLAAVLAALALAAVACSSTSNDDAGDNDGGDSSNVPAESSKGVTDSEITIGVEFLDSATATAATQAAGIDQVEPENQFAVDLTQAIFDSINADGGVAGRDLVPVYHFVNINEGTFATRDAEGCAAFTEDNEVFAVVTFANGTIGLAQCLADAQTPVIWEQGVSWPFDQEDLEALAPYMYMPSKVNLSRFGSYIDGLADQGFFEPDSVVGLLRYDLPSHERATENVIVPALQEQGLELAEQFAFTPVNGAEDLAGASVQAGSAVVQFRDAGVDRVILLPTAQVVPLIFPTIADTQGYYPLYGISSADAPAFMTGAVPPASLEGALGTGWDSSKDLGLAGLDVIEENELYTTCQDIALDAGLDPPEATGDACAPFRFLQEALAGLEAGDAVNPEALRAGVDELGTTAYSGIAPGTDWGPDIYDGPSEMRPMAYDADCDCFQYTGDNQPIGR